MEKVWNELSSERGEPVDLWSAWVALGNLTLKHTSVPGLVKKCYVESFVFLYPVLLLLFSLQADTLFIERNQRRPGELIEFIVSWDFPAGDSSSAGQGEANLSIYAFAKSTPIILKQWVLWAVFKNHSSPWLTLLDCIVIATLSGSPSLTILTEAQSPITFCVAVRAGLDMLWWKTAPFFFLLTLNNKNCCSYSHAFFR